jgi:diadenosine tetraphosphatase ApaH/serine/threonine PP2A family protein phosphatase
MPPFALVYDVHGNLPALDAVLADARQAGAEHFLLGGDYALFGPWPRETVEVLRTLEGAIWIRGNVDRWCAHPEAAPDDPLIRDAIDACRRELGSDLATELGALEAQRVLDGVRYCHGSPASDLRSFMPQPAEEDEELLAGSNERRVVFGHTHLQFQRLTENGVELVNPGSVGLPFDGDPRAAYALVEDGRVIELRRVSYDHRESARAMRERYHASPWAERTARRLEAARMVD